MRARRWIWPTSILFFVLMMVFASCKAKTRETRDPQKIIEELVVDYGSYQDEAASHINSLLKELKTADSNLGLRWQKIVDLWMSLDSKQMLNYDVLPDGLSESDDLCIVALGFQLKEDGTMREELIQRLNVVLSSAKKYPNCYIVCTGGGTAAKNDNVTEAGAMAKWLIEKGIKKERIIIENKSLTTAQNAIFTYDILSTQYPKVKQLAIISSDYHIATGELLFEAESILRASSVGKEKYEVVSNACWKAPSGSLSPMFQAGALIELSGDTETAFKIYYDNYDIHELPPLK